MVAGPVLKTERLILRPIAPSDADIHFKCMRDWNIVRFFAKGFPHPYPDGASAAFIEKVNSAENPVIYWAIALQAKPERLVGSAELRPHRDEGQRGFWMDSDYHNQGIMTETLYAVNDYWFETLDRTSLHMANAVGNAASRRVKEKTGATFLGTRQDPHVDPDLNEIELWHLSRDDWRLFKKKNSS